MTFEIYHAQFDYRILFCVKIKFKKVLLNKQYNLTAVNIFVFRHILPEGLIVISK